MLARVFICPDVYTVADVDTVMTGSKREQVVNEVGRNDKDLGTLYSILGHYLKIGKKALEPIPRILIYHSLAENFVYGLTGNSFWN